MTDTTPPFLSLPSTLATTVFEDGDCVRIVQEDDYDDSEVVITLSRDQAKAVARAIQSLLRGRK